jgi:hypothetical protein
VREVDDLAGDRRVKDVGVEIGPAGPHDGSQFWVDADLAERGCVAKRLEYPAKGHQRRHVDFAGATVVEAEVEAVTADWANFDYVFQHGLLERFDLVERLLFAGQLPVREELFAMKRRPLGDQAQRLRREVAGQ